MFLPKIKDGNSICQIAGDALITNSYRTVVIQTNQIGTADVQFQEKVSPYVQNKIKEIHG